MKALASIRSVDELASLLNSAARASSAASVRSRMTANMIHLTVSDVYYELARDLDRAVDQDEVKQRLHPAARHVLRELARILRDTDPLP